MQKSRDSRKILVPNFILKKPSSGSRVVPCGQTGMENEIVAFRKFANALKDQNVEKLRIKILNATHQMD